MLNVVKKWQSVLVVVVLFASSFSLLASSIPTSLSDIEDASYDTQIGTIEDDSDMSKIQPSLSAKIYDEQKGMVKIFVPTLDVSELYGLLKEYRYQGLIGDRVGSSGELAIPTLEVPISLVTKIASLDSVIGVYEYPSTISKDRLLESIYDGENSDGLYGIPDDEPMSLYDAKHHNLEQAWSDGYTGTGVIVGMPDSGVDFGHPDLRGTQARVPAVPATVTAETVVALADEGQDNATLAHGNVIPGSETIYLNETATTAFTIDYATGALTFTTALAFNVTVTADYQYNSPYVGWPMAFDPASLGTYLDTERANGTWYVNTSYNTTAITIPADVVIDSDAEWDTYLEIINETVYGPAVGNGIERIFYLDHEDIVLGTYTLYIKDGAAWIKLVNDIHYELYPSTGKIKLTSDYGVLNSGMILYAYYNYTNPNINLVTEGVPTPTEGGTPQSMVVSGLEPGVPYSFAIKTKDEADNIGGMSNSPAGTAGIDSVLPGGIVDLTVEPSEDHSSVLINWTAPGDDGNEVGTTVTEYIVKYSTLPISNRVCFDYIDPEFTFTIEGNLSAGGKESRVISGTDDLRLPPGERLYFAIVGVDEAGNRGEISNCPPPVYVKNDIFPPAAITDLSAEIGFQHGEVNLTWTAPGDDGADGTAMGYTIKYSMSPITTEVEFDAALPVPLAAPIPQSGGSTEEFVVTGLGAGLTYYFAVETFDETDPMAVVQGILSSGPSLFAEAMDDSISPGQITDLNAVPGPNHASVRLFWNATGDDGAVGQATKYVIKYNTVDVYASASTYDPGLVDTWTPNTAGGAEEFVLERTMFGPISANTFYYFWVQAVDDGFRMGTPSASASATSTNDTIAPEAINDLSTAVADNHGYIILEWTAPHEDGGIGGACKQYVIKHSETPIIDEATFAAAAPLYLANPLDPGATETHLISLIHLYTPGTTLYFAIKAVDEAVSYGPLDLPSLPVSDVLRDDTIAPSTIGNLVATTADNNGEVVLNWTAPGDDDATGTASSYVIKYRKAISEYKEVAFEKKQFGVINPTYKDVMYNVTGIPTLDGVYRLGIHPDPNLALANGMAEEVPPVYNYSRVLLVVDPSGLDVVYVDLDFDQDFSDEKPCFFGDEVAWAEWVNDEGDDELRSGGMIYFISDGTTPIPYSDVYCDRYGLDNVIPGDDEMVCFFGEFGEGAISGTERASVIVGQGRLDSDLADPDIYNQAISQGIAPEAKIMAVTDSMFDGWYFTVEGYDGTPGTGDEAQIVSTGASIDVYENGWDFYSKFLDWLTYIYSDGRTSFVAGSGDTPGGGYGFGTINAPGASPAVITAGSGIDYYYRTGLTGPGGEKYDGGTSPGYGDIYPTSSRGPTMAGDPKPDIIATGAFTVSSTPINSGTGTDIWMGPGLASSTASGILALVHDAYFEAVHTARKEFVLNASANTTEAQLYHRPVVAGTLTVWIDGVETTAFSLDAETGIITFDSNVTIGEVITATYDFKDQFPDVESGRSILMSGADDMNYDPMSQGAGYCNAAESTKIASTTGGARVTPNRWTPGDYKGTLYDYFIKLYSSETKDENMKKEFTIENYDLFAINAHVHAGVMEKTGETLYIVETTKTKQSSWTVLNADGIFDKEGNMLGSINSTLWENAGLVKITASSDAAEMDLNDDGVIDLSYALEIHDWTDRWNAGVSGLFDGDIFPDTYAGGEGYEERNRFTSHFPERNGEGLYATIYNPANRSADGLLIWVRGLTGGDVTWYVKCEFYEKSDLMSSEPNIKFYEEDGTTTLPSQISVGPGEAYNFVAEMIVPEGTRPGTYECAIYVDKVRTVVNENVIGTTSGGETVAWLENKNLIDCTISNSDGVIATTEDVDWDILVESATEGQSFAMGNDGLNFDNVVPGSENVQKVNDYIYESVNMTSPDQGHLANGNVVGTPEIRKNGTFEVVNETVAGPMIDGQLTFNLGYQNIINCSMWVDDNGSDSMDWDWWELAEGPFMCTLDYTTGEVTMDWPWYEMWDGPYVHVWLNYSSMLLTNPLDYTIDNKTGIIDLAIPLLPNETIMANYSATEDFELYVDYAINYAAGDLRFTVPNIVDNESYIFPDPFVEDDTWISNNTFNLTYVNLLNCTLYYTNATQCWHEMTRSSVAANMTTRDYNYTINYEKGQIEFSKIMVGEDEDNLVPFASWNLTAGDKIYAFYNYTALDLGDNIRAKYSYYPYVVDYNSGKISFTEALDQGDTINVTYTYRTTTTIPIVLNVAANDPKFEFGGNNTFDISNEEVLTAVGGETSVWLTYNNIVDGSYIISNSGIALNEYGEIPRTEILNNSNKLVDEYVLVAAGSETSANLDYGPSAYRDIIVRDSESIYFNGMKLNGSVIGEEYNNEITDYIIDLVTGELYFCPDRVYNETVVNSAIAEQKTFSLDHDDIIWQTIYMNNSAAFIANETAVPEASSGQSSFSLAHGNVLNTSQNNLYYYNSLSKDWIKMTLSPVDSNVPLGFYNYTINNQTGSVYLTNSSQWSLQNMDRIYAYYNYTGWINLNSPETVTNETVVVSAAGGETSFILQHPRLIEYVGIEPVWMKNDLYLNTSPEGWIKLNHSDPTQTQPGKYNCTIDSKTGEVTLLEWSLKAGDSIHAYYNYNNLPYDVNKTTGDVELSGWSLKTGGEVYATYDHSSWLYQNYHPQPVENISVVDSATAGQTVFSTAHEDLVNGSATLHLNRSGNWILMKDAEPYNYTIDNTTGDVTLLGWSLNAGDQIYASYEYYSGGLEPDTNITADYNYYDPTIINIKLPHGSIIPNSYKLWKDGLEYSATNYKMNLNTGIISFNEPVGLALIEATYSYGHYTVDKITGEISFNLLSEAFNETFVPTTEVDTVSLNYSQIFNGTFYVWDDIIRQVEDETVNISAGDPLGHVENGNLLNYTFYYTNETSVVFMMNYSATPGNYNYTVDNETGDVTLLGWTMGSDADESINAYYNYTEIDWQRLIPKTDDGKYYYELDSENGTVSFNNWSLKEKYIETNDWNATVINTFKAFYNYTGLAPADEITADYQYRDGNKRLFSTDAVYGGGDWRFYYVEIPDGGLNRDPLTKFFVNLTWDNRLADIDVITFGPTIPGNSAPGSYDFSSDRYGPHTLQNNGGSTETAAFFTATGGPQEYAMSDLSPGLNVIGLHSTLMTASNFESVRGEVGNIKISTDEVKVVSNEYSGSFNISTVCSLDWQGQLGGVAAGPSAPVSYLDMLVYQDEDDWTLFDTFEEQLASGNTSVYVTLKDCLIFDVHIYGHREHGYKDLDDLDLGIFLDENGDGITQAGEFVAMDADWDADEHVKLIAPKDGDYIIRVFGFTLKTIPAHYDVDITIVQGLGFAVNGKGDDTAPDENDIFSSETKLPAHTIGEIELSWDLAGVKEGVPLMGAMYIGPGNGPMTSLMAIDLGFDFTEPGISGLTPGEGDVVNDKMPLIGVTFEDYDRGELVDSTMEIYLDGNRITAQSSINVPYDDENAGGGFPMGTISYILPGPLDDGVHIVEARCGDLAGNVAERTWSFTIDTGSPSLSINEPSEEVSYTNSDSFVIAGEFEIDTSLAIMGTNVNKLDENPDGTFRAEITLESGRNSIVISATDKAGNKAEIKRTIVLDRDMPVFEGFASLEGSRTNRDKVTITGEMSETGTMTINSMEINVNSDGSFSTVVSLREGDNVLHLVFTDHAGNSINDWLNITLDQTLPKIVMDDLPTEVSSNNFTFSAQIIEDELKVGGVLVNGKQVTVNATRGVSEFDRTVFLSYGLNTIVIEAKDKAGNVVELRHTVEYAPDYGTNNAAIGMMIMLLIVGLIVGLLIAMGLWKEKPEPVEPEETPSDEDLGEISEDLEAVDAEEGMEVVDGEEIPEGEVLPEGEEMPDDEVPGEEVPETDIEAGDAVEEGEIPEGEVLPEGEEMPDDEVPGEEVPETDVEDVGDEELPMPKEDMSSEEIGDSLLDEEMAEEPKVLEDMDKAAPEDEITEMSDEGIEDIEPEPKMEDVEPEPDVEAAEPETGAVVEEISEEPEAESETESMEDAEAPEEDERVQRLRQAFEDGKISQELFDKNLAKLKGE